MMLGYGHDLRIHLLAQMKWRVVVIGAKGAPV
jgi:hypothetical protein